MNHRPAHCTSDVNVFGSGTAEKPNEKGSIGTGPLRYGNAWRPVAVSWPVWPDWSANPGGTATPLSPRATAGLNVSPVIGELPDAEGRLELVERRQPGERVTPVVTMTAW